MARNLKGGVGRRRMLKGAAGIAGAALGSGAVTVPIAATFSLDQANDAYDAFAAGGKFGKIVLEI